jgi:hypothetical protein
MIRTKGLGVVVMDPLVAVIRKVMEREWQFKAKFRGVTAGRGLAHLVAVYTGRHFNALEPP